MARSPEIIFRSRPPNTCAFAYPLNVLQATVSTWAWNVVGKNKNNNFSKDLRFIMRSKLKKKINFCPSLSRHLIVDNPVSEILIWRMKKKNDCIHHYPIVFGPGTLFQRLKSKDMHLKEKGWMIFPERKPFSFWDKEKAEWSVIL